MYFESLSLNRTSKRNISILINSIKAGEGPFESFISSCKSTGGTSSNNALRLIWWRFLVSSLSGCNFLYNPMNLVFSIIPWEGPTPCKAPLQCGSSLGVGKTFEDETNTKGLQLIHRYSSETVRANQGLDVRLNKSKLKDIISWIPLVWIFLSFVKLIKSLNSPLP